jgi:hypothetical protein
LAVFEPAVREELGKELTSERCKISYSNGRSVTVPSWLISERGHRLFSALGRITEAARSRQEVVKAFKRVRLVPEELVEIFERTTGYQRSPNEDKVLSAKSEVHVGE